MTFREIILRDNPPRFLTRWAYQGRRFNTQATAEDLIDWMKWFGDRPGRNFHIETQIKATDIYAFKNLGIPFPENYEVILRENEIDLHFQTLLKSGSSIRTVLDFGPGYGRNANFWGINKTYIGVEGVQKPYELQRLYYGAIGGFWDYIDFGDGFRIEKNMVNHIPTWRFDLIPDNSVDMIICVQVLQELFPKLFRWVAGQFQRVLRSDGILYVRDCPAWKPVHTINTDKYFNRHGFWLEYRGHFDESEVHGTPRLFRKRRDIETFRSSKFSDMISRIKKRVNYPSTLKR
jgi:SAM-dependent methyltransferase